MKLSKRLRFLLIGFTAQLLLITTLFSYAAENDLEDKDITSAVEVELILDEGVSSHLIDVSTSEGIVTLSGSVGNILAKERAVKIARSVKGVRSVIDELEVKPVEQSDYQVRVNVENALLTDPATDLYEVNVEVDNSIVTLSGTVDSYAEKELCAKVARGIKGVKEVKNDTEVDYKSDRPDYEIKADIEKRLKFDVRVDDGLIQVEVDDGHVKLSGTVGSAEEKEQAKWNAWVSGVRSVDVSQLEIKWWARDKMVRKESYTSLSDEKVKQAVNDALLYDPRVWPFHVDVDVDYGTVTLTGTVDNLKAKRAAEEDAENTLGVWRVKNHLRVRPEDEWKDSEIAENVREALSLDPYIDRYEVMVSSYNGKVYLYGVVDTYFEKNQAEDVASRVKGVVEVQNNLQVQFTPEWRTETWKADWEIKEDIEGELFWSPFVDADQVTVSVEDGVATLTGTVETWSERRSATKNALDGGAIRVINKLQVSYGSDYWPF